MLLKKQLPQGWQEALKNLPIDHIWERLDQFLFEEERKHAVLPPMQTRFKALEETPFDKVKVVIVGQDPYVHPREATGMAFSVPKSTPIPRALRNIFIEISKEYNAQLPEHGDLTAWAHQGVLLLNSILTVRQRVRNSHINRGWERITNAMIQAISDQKDSVAFILWGCQAQMKERFIDSNKHLILKAAHPSPLSASRGFFGCNHFLQANQYLQEKGLTPIEWFPL